MDYEKLKEVIAKKIKENGRREITGPILQAVLMAMVDCLGEVYPHTYTDEEKAQARANIDALSNYDGAITKEKLSAEVQAILNDVANKQNITDESLATIAKTIVGAINELFNGGIKDKSIATSKIEDGAITEDKLASQSVTNAKIANASVSEEKITSNSVSTEKLKDGAITEPKLDTDLVNIITSAVQPADLASAIAAAVALYVAKTDIVSTTGSATDKVMSQHGVTEAINGVTNKVTELGTEVNDRIKLLLGYNAARSIVNLELGISGKYVQCESRSAVANSSFAISKPFAVDACSELLIKTGFNPSDAAHAALDLTVIAIYEEIERQRTVQKKDSSGNPMYYVVVVDPETGSESPTSDETTVNTGYPVYVQETYTETRYLPNNEDRFVAIPDSGYYVANIPQSCQVVVSYKPGVTDTAVIIEKHGALANLISQVFGIYEHRTMVEAMVSLAARVDALESSRGLLGNATAGNLDVSQLTKCLYPVVMKAHGVPAEANVPVNLPEGLPWDGIPAFVGQLYINLDAASGGLYYAAGTDSVNNWKQA